MPNVGLYRHVCDRDVFGVRKHRIRNLTPRGPIRDLAPVEDCGLILASECKGRKAGLGVVQRQISRVAELHDGGRRVLHTAHTGTLTVSSTPTSQSTLTVSCTPKLQSNLTVPCTPKSQRSLTVSCTLTSQSTLSISCQSKTQFPLPTQAPETHTREVPTN